MTRRYVGNGVHVITYATHAALLHLESGDGFLVLPDVRDDVTLDGESLQESSLTHILNDLESIGWSLSDDCDDEMCNGRLIHGLYNTDGSTDIDLSVSGQVALSDALNSHVGLA